MKNSNNPRINAVRENRFINRTTGVFKAICDGVLFLVTSVVIVLALSI